MDAETADLKIIGHLSSGEVNAPNKLNQSGVTQGSVAVTTIISIIIVHKFVPNQVIFKELNLKEYFHSFDEAEHSPVLA